YRPQNRCQGDLLGVCTQGKWLVYRPALHVTLGDLADQLAVAAHALAVKGRQQKLALTEVLGLVERQHRIWTERRLEYRRIGLTRVEESRVAGEDSLDDFRIGHIDDSPEVGERQRENVAKATVKAGEEAKWIARVPEPLHDPGNSWAGRKVRRGDGGSRGRGCVLHRTLTLGEPGPAGRSQDRPAPGSLRQRRLRLAVTRGQISRTKPIRMQRIPSA